MVSCSYRCSAALGLNLKLDRGKETEGTKIQRAERRVLCCPGLRDNGASKHENVRFKTTPCAELPKFLTFIIF